MRQSIERTMAMAMCAALYVICADLGQLVPGEHEACRFTLTLQPAACVVDKCSDNIKCRGKAVGVGMPFGQQTTLATQ